jgi:hypothetical protein
VYALVFVIFPGLEIEFCTYPDLKNAAGAFAPAALL